MDLNEILKIENFTEKEKKQIKSRLQYIKRKQGEILNLTKNTKYDDIIFKFLKSQMELKNIYSSENSDIKQK